MIAEPQYIIIAGINGAGKSTLYKAQPGLFDGTERLNADEITQQLGLDWRNPRDNFQAMRIEVERLHKLLANRQSLHIETTLAGGVNTHMKLLSKAKEKSYHTTLIYIGVDSAKVAVQRVADRIAKGGHGIPEDVIQRRYNQSLQNLPTIAELADEVLIFDNSDSSFQIAYVRSHDVSGINRSSRFDWLNGCV